MHFTQRCMAIKPSSDMPEHLEGCQRRLRISLSAAHTVQDVDELLDALRACSVMMSKL